MELEASVSCKICLVKSNMQGYLKNTRRARLAKFSTSVTTQKNSNKWGKIILILNCIFSIIDTKFSSEFTY